MNSKTPFILLIAVFLSLQAFSQHLAQTVRGTVSDTDSQMPLAGVQVIVVDSDPLKGTITDSNGEFRLNNVTIGRISLKFAYIGYKTTEITNHLVIAGKETIIKVGMQEAVNKMQEVVITATDHKGKALNDMAVVSARAISSEETNRYAGGFNDPARILSNFAGINNSRDGSADIIVRGNSPKYLQWRLEGVQITNPSHFADPSGLESNGISTLNNNMLSTADFYTGAFPAAYGDALSGVYDIRLRKGNDEKVEGILGVGIIGTDATLEGPFKKGYRGSFIINYRFTTVDLINKIGLMSDLGGIPRFQDGAFKLDLPTNKMGKFSLFGLWGSSSIKFKDVNPGIWVTPGDSGLREEIEEDFNKKANLFNTGLSHTLSIGKNSYLRTTFAYSQEGIRDEILERKVENDSTLLKRENFKSKINNRTYRANLTFGSKLDSRNNILTGVKYAHLNQNFDVSHLQGDGTERIPLARFNEGINVLSSFVSWKHRFGERLSVVMGLHNMNVLYNNKHTLEPRIAANWEVTPANSLHVGYGMHSTMERVHNYFASVKMPDGTFAEPNRNLGLLKAHHFVVEYGIRLSKNLRGKAAIYYQHLYNLPVENNDTSSYATINENLDIRYVDLVNQGTRHNYGLEVSLERFFADDYYFMVNASLFEANYKALDGVERNTAFNNNFLVNVLGGKAFTQLGKKKNKTFAVNAKVFIGGGRRFIPLLRDDQGNLAVNPGANQFYDENKAYSYSLDNIYTITLAFSYKWNKPNRTQELFLNIDNITNNKPRLSEYYDPSVPDNIAYTRPLGLFPNLMYRLYF